MAGPGSRAGRVRLARLGAHRRRRPDHPHRRDQPAQRVPRRRRRHRHEHAVHHALGAGEANAEADSADVVTPRRPVAGALNGARGNSGVILSQILRGIADVTAQAAAESGGELHDIDATLLGAALHRGVDLAVASMGGREVKGTIVSVLEAAGRRRGRRRLRGTGAAGGHRRGDAAVIALEKTPQQLDVLADAGVVDAGGRGLLVLLDALTATLTGHAPGRITSRHRAGRRRSSLRGRRRRSSR